MINNTIFMLIISLTMIFASSIQAAAFVPERDGLLARIVQRLADRRDTFLANRANRVQIRRQRLQQGIERFRDIPSELDGQREPLFDGSFFGRLRERIRSRLSKVRNRVRVRREERLYSSYEIDCVDRYTDLENIVVIRVN